MNSHVNRQLSEMIVQRSPYASWYDVCQKYVRDTNVQSDDLLNTIYTLSSNNNIKESDYYYDVVCEIMSVLAGRCDTDISLSSKDIKSLVDHQ